MERVLVYKMSDEIGGTETFLMNYNNNLLDKKQLKMDFVAETSQVAFRNEIIKKGEKIYHIPPRHESPIKHMLSFRKLLREHPEYKTIYCCIHSAPAVLSIIAGLGLGRKVVVHSHNGGVKAIYRHKLCRIILNRLAKTKLACSENAARFMFGDKQFEAGNVKIIPNAIDVKKFQYDENVRIRMRAQYNCADKIVFGVVGRLSNQKNPLRTLRVFKKIHEENEMTVLYMIGDGELREEVTNYINQNGMQDCVHLMGVVQNVNEWMQAFDVFLLMSNYEGFPMVGVEAQCAGLPCIFSSAVTREIAFSDKVFFYDETEDVTLLTRWYIEKINLQRCNSIPNEYDIAISGEILLEALI